MSNLFVLPKQVPLNTAGNLLSGAKAYFYRTGTTTPKNTYSDAALTTPNANPVVADSAGTFGPIFLDTTVEEYRLKLNTSTDVLIYQQDNVGNRFDLTRTIIGGLLYPRNGAEIAFGFTPTTANLVYPYYDLRRYAGVGDNTTINDTPIANWKGVCDQADAEGLIPEGQFKISAQVEFPRKVKCYGEITGAFNVLYQKRQNGWIKGLKCEQIYLRGLYFCNIQDLYCTTATVDGFSDVYGTFWNEFIQWRVEGTLTVDITNFAVNLNAWRGGRIGYCHFTGNAGTYPSTHGHDNTWDGVDFTHASGPPYGFLQDDSAMEVNHLRSIYFEAGATIKANAHISGYQGDALGMPAISRFAHIMGSVGRNPRLSRDFLSLTVQNLALGGSWDILDSGGKPPSVTNSGGASVAVAADTTEPSGVGFHYEASFADAFDQFSFTLQPSGSDRFGFVVFYKSTADFFAITSNDGSGDTSHTTEPVVVDSGNNWKMLRICGPASKTATSSIILFAYGAAGGAAKFMAIGGFFAGAERAVITPQRPQTRVRFGSAAYDPPSLADGAGATTTVSVAGAAFGGHCIESFGGTLSGIITRSYVSAADTVSVRFQNESGGVLDLASATLRVQLQEPYA